MINEHDIKDMQHFPQPPESKLVNPDNPYGLDLEAVAEDFLKRNSWLDTPNLRDMLNVNKGAGAPTKEEYDPNGKQAHEAGSKLDAGKSPVYQGLLDYFPRACLAVANISAIGAQKYTWKGWETVENGFSRYSDALARHLVKEGFEYLDEDTKRPHAEQVAWNAMARLELLLREQEAK